MYGVTAAIIGPAAIGKRKGRAGSGFRGIGSNAAAIGSTSKDTGEEDKPTYLFEKR